MDGELNERILECLRGLEIGESISADGIADEIGEKLSDVYDVLEDLENAKLVEMNPAYRKGSDPTYVLTAKGKRYGTAVTIHAGKVSGSDEFPEPEPRPSADRVCRFCKKEMEPNKVRRHERFCRANPDRDMPGRTPKEQPVPAPFEYAEEDSNAEITIEHEAPVEPEFPEFLDQLNAEDPDVPDEVPDQAQDVLVLKGSPGMDAALRLISYCQQMVNDGADLSLESSVKIADGFYISVSLDIPKRESDE